MAYQTFVVHIIVLFNVLMALIAVNVQPLGINNPWLLLVGIPFAVAAGTYGANQMKSIGAPPPATTRVETVTERTSTPPQ